MEELPVGRSEVIDADKFKEILESQLSADERKFTLAARLATPNDDWSEIIAYICKYHDAYGFAPPIPGGAGRMHLFFPWLAAVAICALDDIGR